MGVAVMWSKLQPGSRVDQARGSIQAMASRVTNIMPCLDPATPISLQNSDNGMDLIASPVTVQNGSTVAVSDSLSNYRTLEITMYVSGVLCTRSCYASDLSTADGVSLYATIVTGIGHNVAGCIINRKSDTELSVTYVYRQGSDWGALTAISVEIRRIIGYT